MSMDNIARRSKTCHNISTLETHETGLKTQSSNVRDAHLRNIRTIDRGAK